MAQTQNNRVPTSTHWGHYQVEIENEELVAIHGYDFDPDPAEIAQSMLDSFDQGARIPQPMVRAGFLEQGANSDRSGRGREPFVPVSWETALDLVAAELKRVAAEHGNRAIYAGSYGWASPGTLHFPRWNMHRLLNLNGGFTGSIGSYSTAASEAITRYVLDHNDQLVHDAPAWSEIARHTELVVLFGGSRVSNAQVSFGGLGGHTPARDMATAHAAGVRFVNISPIRDDLALELGADWHAPRPNTDTAIMLALAHTLVTEDRVDRDFVETYTVGFERFLPYLMGESDGIPKTPEWAESISEMPAAAIRALARDMAEHKTLISCSWAIQRAEHGEQPYWMAIVLAAMLGEIGLPGRGVTFGLNAMHALGAEKRPAARWPSRPTGSNPVADSMIPVARIADMLLNPGKPFDFLGEEKNYPKIELIYWVGGNPFHHHQDLNRLIKAWQQPETIIINDPFWTATTRYADIVLPANTALERNDINFTLLDNIITPMRQVRPPYAQSRSDYDIFFGIAKRMGVADEYSAGRDEMDWLRHFYETAIRNAATKGVELPDFETFWLGGALQIDGERRVPNVERFRQDPTGAPLKTATGKIEIYSEKLAGFGYQNCGGHPQWLPVGEWLGAKRAAQIPLHLLSNQPRTRLHSQYDHARVSLGGKVAGREPTRMHPADAAERNIKDGDFIRLFNDRGACLSVVQLSDALRRGVVQLSTGAWYNPTDPHTPDSLEIHGNPNVLTRDVGTSQLGQGPSPNSTLVEVERYTGPVPEVTVHQQPKTVRR